MERALVHTDTPYPYHFFDVTGRNRQLTDQPRCVSPLQILIRNEATQAVSTRCNVIRDEDAQRTNDACGYRAFTIL